MTPPIYIAVDPSRATPHLSGAARLAYIMDWHRLLMDQQIAIGRGRLTPDWRDHSACLFALQSAQREIAA